MYPGNLRAMVQAKLKNLRTGSSFEHRFRAADTIEKASMETHELEFMYQGGDSFHFMNTENYDQLEMDEEEDDILFIGSALPADVTMDEAFELLTLLQTGKAQPAPVIMLDVPGGVTTIELKVAEIFEAERLAREIERRHGLAADSWMGLNQQLLVGLRSQSASSWMIQALVVLADETDARVLIVDGSDVGPAQLDRAPRAEHLARVRVDARKPHQLVPIPRRLPTTPLSIARMASASRTWSVALTRRSFLSNAQSVA